MKPLRSVQEIVDPSVENDEAWKVLPFAVGMYGIGVFQRLVDFHFQMIAERKDYGWVEIHEPVHCVLDAPRILDFIRFPLFGAPELKGALQIVNEWGLADEIRDRVRRYRLGILYQWDFRKATRI